MQPTLRCFAAFVFTLLVSLTAHSADFHPASGKYTGHQGGYTITFHFAGDRVTDCTIGGVAAHHLAYHPHDHSFSASSHSASVDAKWINSRTVHGHFTLHKVKTKFEAHIHSPGGS